MLSLLKSFPTLYGSQKDMNASELESFKREAFQVLSTMSFDSFQVLLPLAFQLATQRMLYHLVFTQLNLQRNVPSICLLLTCFPLEYQRIQRNVCQKRRRTGLRNALLSLSHAGHLPGRSQSCDHRSGPSPNDRQLCQRVEPLLLFVQEREQNGSPFPLFFSP